MIINMETLPEKKNNLPVARENAVAILYSGTAKAIDVRRAMVELPEVAKALTTVEKYIFAAIIMLPDIISCPSFSNTP